MQNCQSKNSKISSPIQKNLNEKSFSGLSEYITATSKPKIFRDILVQHSRFTGKTAGIKYPEHSKFCVTVVTYDFFGGRNLEILQLFRDVIESLEYFRCIFRIRGISIVENDFFLPFLARICWVPHSPIFFRNQRCLTCQIDQQQPLFQAMLRFSCQTIFFHFLIFVNPNQIIYCK